MFRNRSARLFLTLMILPLALAASRAAVTVTGARVTGTGAPYDVNYVLNTDATSGRIEILNASSQVVRTVTLTAGDLSKGLHHYLWDGNDDTNNTVPSGNYRARITASAAAVPAGGAKLWGPVDPNPPAATPIRYGLTVNRNAGSPYFGNIYVCDYSGDTLHIYNADGSKRATFAGEAGNPYKDFRSGIRDVFIASDDRIYVMVQTDSSVSVVAGVLSMKQDGTDVKREMDTADQPRGFFVTLNGAAKRFYFSYSTSNSQTNGPSAIVLASIDEFGIPSSTTILGVAVDPTAFQGLVDDFVVLDSFNDPVGHANSITIFARHNTATSGGVSTVIKWDGDTAEPVMAFWQQDPGFNPGTLGFGRGLSRGPDGNLWTTISQAAIPDRGYIKLNQATGAQMAKVDVPLGDGKPRFNDSDHKGNVVALTVKEDATSTYAKYLLMYAPEDSGSTDSTTSPAFAVSGVVLPPIVISDLAVVQRTDTTATVAWTTNVAASSEVSFGPSAISLPNIATSAPGTSHEVTLTGLTKNAQVFYQARSSATGYATAESSVLSFATKDVATMGAVQVTNVTQTSATISWTTGQTAGKPTGSLVLYGVEPGALAQSAAGNTDPVNHTVTLSNLQAGVTYYFVASSGSDDVQTVSSDVQHFSTLSTNGYHVWTFRTPGQLAYGHLNDVLLKGGGVELNTAGLPSAVDDAGVADLPEGASNQAVVAHGGYLYNLGGRHPSVNKDTVYVAPISPDGSVQGWRETTPLPDVLYFFNHGAFGYSGRIYVVAGGNPSAQITTLMAKQNPLTGELGPWTVAGSFPEGDGNERDAGAVAVYNGRVYYTAGENNAGAVATAYVAEIKGDGTLSDWTLSDAAMPVNRVQHVAAFRNGTLYVWGGAESVAATQIPVLGTLKTTPISNPPDIAPWSQAGPDLAAGRVGFAGGIFHGQALMVAGSDGSARTTAISTAPFLADGSLDAFTDAAVTWPIALRDLDGAAWQDRFYVLGGRSSDTAPTYDANASAKAAAITFTNTGYAGFGRYESAIMDLGTAQPLVSLAMSATGSATLSYRIAGADGVFGAWTSGGATVNFSGATARYVQFALDLVSGGSTTPVVSSVELTYGTQAAVITPDDARRAMSIAGGLIGATSTDMTKLNVNGDASITVEDAVLLMKQALGL